MSTFDLPIRQASLDCAVKYWRTLGDSRRRSHENERIQIQGESGSERWRGAYVIFPYDTEKEFATKGRVQVKATFNGVPYTGSLVKYEKPLHVLGMPKAIRVQTGKGPGDTVEVVVWREEGVRIVEVPLHFAKLMQKEDVLPIFEKLSYTHRKEYCSWIVGAKKKETRLRRLHKAIEMLKTGVRTPG